MFAALGFDLIVAGQKRNASANMSPIRWQNGGSERRYNLDVIAAAVGNGHIYGPGEIPRLTTIGGECQWDYIGKARACERKGRTENDSAYQIQISHVNHGMVQLPQLPRA